MTSPSVRWTDHPRELQREFLSLQQRLQKTVVFVTHDLREALLLGNGLLSWKRPTLTALPPDNL